VGACRPAPTARRQVWGRDDRSQQNSSLKTISSFKEIGGEAQVEAEDRSHHTDRVGTARTVSIARQPVTSRHRSCESFDGALHRPKYLMVIKDLVGDKDRLTARSRARQSAINESRPSVVGRGFGPYRAASGEDRDELRGSTESAPATGAHKETQFLAVGRSYGLRRGLASAHRGIVRSPHGPLLWNPCRRGCGRGRTSGFVACCRGTRHAWRRALAHGRARAASCPRALLSPLY